LDYKACACGKFVIVLPSRLAFVRFAAAAHDQPHRGPFDAASDATLVRVLPEMFAFAIVPV